MSRCSAPKGAEAFGQTKERFGGEAIGDFLLMTSDRSLLVGPDSGKFLSLL
jgi:hypothetical protein